MGIPITAFSEITGLIGNTGSKTAFTYVANGSGSTAFATSQTALVSENASDSGSNRAAATVAQATTTIANDTLRFTKTWTAGASITIRELGVFNASSSGTMLARKVLAGDKNITSGETYALTYDVIFA
jgi:hypothetical protein